MLHNLLRRYYTNKLCKAARKGNVRNMSACIAKGADIGGPGGRVMPPLFLCSSIGCIEGVKLLLDSGADIHQTFTEDGTALHIALLNGQADLALFLIDRGANIHKCTITGVTPMHLAALGGLLPVLKRLLRDGVNIHALTTEGQNAIYCSLLGLSLNATTDPSCLRLLFAAGSDPRVGGQVLEENMKAFSTQANAFFREQMEALAERTGDENLRSFTRRIIAGLTGQMVSPKLGTLTRSDDEELADWWYSGPVTIPFWDNVEMPVVYVFFPEKDPEFITDADTAVANFLKKTRKDRMDLALLLEENCRRICAEKGVPGEELARWFSTGGEYAVWNLVAFPEALYVQRRHRRDQDVYVQMSMDCSWDKENGTQLVFRRGLRVTRVSTDDGWLTDADAHGLLDAEDELLSAFTKKQPKS